MNRFECLIPFLITKHTILKMIFEYFGCFKTKRMNENGSWMIMTMIPEIGLEIANPTLLGRDDHIHSYLSFGCEETQCFLGCRNDSLIEQEARSYSASPTLEKVNKKEVYK